MKNAVTSDQDWGDAWGWWLKFERQHGEPERQESVIAQAEAAQPHHGPVWQAVSKDIANIGKSTRQILELVADRVE
jgi:pre-mRNA-processing factor 6